MEPTRDGRCRIRGLGSQAVSPRLALRSTSARPSGLSIPAGIVSNSGPVCGEAVIAEQPVSTAVENFADELRAWRERLGWSQAELGAGMGYSGSHVSSVETMSRTATYEFAKKADE